MLSWVSGYASNVCIDLRPTPRFCEMNDVCTQGSLKPETAPVATFLSHERSVPWGNIVA
jgi:hypothetical protein